MAGLLDFLQTPAGQGLLAAGLSAAANAGRGGPVNTIGRAGLGGLLAYNGAQQNALEAADHAKMGQFRDMQIEAYKADVTAKNNALAKDQAKRAALPGLFKQPGMTGGEAVPQSVGGIPMFSQPMNVAPMQATPGGFDVMGAVRAGYSPEEIKQYADLPNVGKPKATRQMEVDDGQGGKRIALVDDYGREVAGFTGYTAPVQVNQGDRVSFVKPTAGVSLGVNMSPSERDASSRGWATVRQGQERLALDRTSAAAGKVPAGYRVSADGQGLEFIPGGPADPNAAKKAAPTEFQGKAAMFGNRASEADKIITELDGKYSPSAINAKKALGGVWGIGGALESAANATLPANAQKAEQAERDFINAVLRLESGAAIGKDEFDNARKQYFPQPFDSAEVKKQKSENRKRAINGLLDNGRTSAAAQANGGATGDFGPSVEDLLKKYGGGNGKH